MKTFAQRLEEIVEKLTDDQRRELRDKLQSEGNKLYLHRALWYNYSNQNWID